MRGTIRRLGPLLGGVSLTYDAAGRVATRSASAGESTTETRYAYDGEGRLEGVTRLLYEDSDEPAATITARFERDAAGAVVACALDDGDGRFRVAYTYDAGGRLLRRAVSDVESGEEAWAWAYRYDCRAPRGPAGDAE